MKRKQMKVMKIAQNTTDATIQTDTPPPATTATPTTLMYQRSVEEVVPPSKHAKQQQGERVEATPATMMMNTNDTAATAAHSLALAINGQGQVESTKIQSVSERHTFSALPCKLKVHIKISPDSKTKNISSSNDISDNTKLTITTVSNTHVSNSHNAEAVVLNDDDDDDEDDEVVVAEIVEEVETPTVAAPMSTTA